MYTVLDLVYTPDEGQECFTGTFEECQDFVGGMSFTYQIVPSCNIK